MRWEGPKAVFDDLLAARAERDRYRAALAVCAKLNCARGPSGKHYKDPAYCGVCTSCQAREALR